MWVGLFWRSEERLPSLRRPAFPHQLVSLPFGVSIVQNVLYSPLGPFSPPPPPRQAQLSKHRLHVISSTPPLPSPFLPLSIQRPSRRFHTELFSHIQYAVYARAGRPFGSFPPLWLHQSWPSMRLSMTPQRLGKPQISLSLGLVSGYGIAVPPMAADLA